MNDQLAQYEALAREAADRVCDDVNPDGELYKVELNAESFDGSNSKDEEFRQKLRDRQHLNDEFLAGV